MENQDRILAIVREKGPLLPVQISGELGTNILLASAMLSEISSKGSIKISYLKVGGSPLYYFPEQEHKLQDFYKYLHEKERKTFDLLKQKKVLRDQSLEPVTRIALRNIKDFAKPLQVSGSKGMELFWKWFLTPQSEAETIIRQMLGKISPAKRVTSAKPEGTSKTPIQETLETPATIPLSGDPFFEEVVEYFKKNRINLIEHKIIRKNSDIEFIINVPSSVGNLTYFCKAKNKKRCNDGDLSSAYLQGQSKKLATIFLTTGELTKKAKGLSEGEFRGISIKQIR